MTGDPVLERAAALDRRRQPYVLATVVWRRAPTSGKPGARALILPDGNLVGWIGGACSGPSVVQQGLRALKKGLPRLVCLGKEDEFPPAGGGRFVVPNDCASEGAMEVFLEPRLPSAHLVIVGGAPLGESLAAMAETLGYEVTAVAPEGSVDAEDIGRRLSEAAVSERSFAVVATMGQYDEVALAAVLATPARYVALVASARRAAAVFEALRGRGVDEERIARVRSPAGLDLGPIAHQEIAVAILAEIVQHRARSEAAATAETTAPAGEPIDAGEAIDPICGMTVAVAAARHTAEHRGTTYYFCCAGCRERFTADPGATIDAA